MHRFQGSVDLRLNADRRGSESSVWPSFTDIMMVVLMVFMLTMVLVIVKNAHLADSVRLSQLLLTTAERQTTALSDSLAALAARNTDLEDRLRSYGMQIILLNDEVDRLESVVDGKLAVVEGLTDENDELLAQVRSIRLQMAEKDAELEAAVLSLDEIRTARSEAERGLRDEITALVAQLRDKDVALLTLSGEKSDLELALARNRQDLSTLEDKYLRLVRPARSAAGKVVASARVARVSGDLIYEFQGPEMAAPVAVSLTDLHRRLAATRDRHGKDLYVKVIIPDDSNLSYNEAWQFTKDVLSRYDYYYEDGWE